MPILSHELTPSKDDSTAPFVFLSMCMPSDKGRKSNALFHLMATLSFHNLDNLIF